MKVSYYPGCALHGSAVEYDDSTRAVSRLLEVELRELPDWNCCGASSAHVTDPTLAHDLAARNLAIAAGEKLDVVVPCAACYGRLKAAEKEAAATAPTPQPFRILSLLEFFAAPHFADMIKGRIQRPLSGLKVVSYYGCLLVRPPRVTGVRNFENPEEMDRIVRLLGAEAIPWSYKTDCCGGSLVLSRTDIALRLTQKLLDKAIEAGAEAVVVACPLCQANLDTREEQISQQAGKAYALPVLYFTELIGLALGHPDAPKWMKKHFIDPAPLLARKGLM